MVHRSVLASAEVTGFVVFTTNGRYVWQLCHQRDQGDLPELRCLVLEVQLEPGNLVV